MFASFFIELLGNASVALFIFNSIVPLVGIGILSNVGYQSGSGTKIVAVMMFLVGVAWFVFGARLAMRLNQGYTSLTPGSAFFKKSMDPSLSAKSKSTYMGLGMASAVLLDTAASRIALQMLPFPLNYFYYGGMFPLYPFIMFGVIPALFSWMCLGSLMSLASVMEAGGDGTEYVEAKKIHWFYSLSAKDRDRVREGSDLEGEGDSENDDDDSVDEEAGLVKSAPKRVHG